MDGYNVEKSIIKRILISVVAMSGNQHYPRKRKRYSYNDKKKKGAGDATQFWKHIQRGKQEMKNMKGRGRNR